MAIGNDTEDLLLSDIEQVGLRAHRSAGMLKLAGRALLWLLIIVVLARGVTAILTDGARLYLSQRHGPAVFELDAGTGDLRHTLLRSLTSRTPPATAHPPPRPRLVPRRLPRPVPQPPMPGNRRRAVTPKAEAPGASPGARGLSAPRGCLPA